ncbi:Os11g0107850, partial [Oryza sativa Japonica Group]
MRRERPKSAILGLEWSSRRTLLAVRLPWTMVMSSWRKARPRAVPLAIVIRVSQLIGVSIDRVLTVEELGEAAVGHEVEDEELLALGSEVVGPERQQVGVADLAQHRRLGLEILVSLGDLLPQPLHRHKAAVLQRRLVHRPVRALPHYLRRRTQQVVRR